MKQTRRYLTLKLIHTGFRQGGNPTDWIRKMKGRMDVVHLKDMAIVKDQQVLQK